MIYDNLPIFAQPPTCKALIVIGREELSPVIDIINKVQWVDIKLENVLVFLHSLKTMGLGSFGASAPLFLRNGVLLGHSPIHNY
jgi:hypothetical protein